LELPTKTESHFESIRLLPCKPFNSKTMSKPRKKFTKAERLEIVKLSLDPETKIRDLADRFEIAVSTLTRWRSQYFLEHGQRPEGQGIKKMSETEKEVHQLKKQLREARLERDILKKAIGIFSKP